MPKWWGKQWRYSWYKSTNTERIWKSNKFAFLWTYNLSDTDCISSSRNHDSPFTLNREELGSEEFAYEKSLIQINIQHTTYNTARHHVLWPFHCEHNISRTPWGNFLKFGTNVQLDCSIGLNSSQLDELIWIWSEVTVTFHRSILTNLAQMFT